MNYWREFAKISVIATSSLFVGLAIGSTPSNYTIDYVYESIAGEQHNFDPDREFNYTGSMKIGNYTIHFQTEEQNENLTGKTRGYTYPGGEKEIWIETGYRASEIERICDHEVFHELFPQFRHPDGDAKFDDPIYRYSDDADIRECDFAVQLALERQ